MKQNKVKMTNNNDFLLSVKNLVIEFKIEAGLVHAVDNISFDIKKGETVGLVGESGCGKSITSLSILGLVPSPPGKILQGSSIKYQGKELVGISENEYRKIRGNEIAMIFQEPMTALNPVFTIGNQMSEVLRRHKQISKAGARHEAIHLLTQVGIPSPEKRLKNYPHELSGGMRQRVMIAMALSCNPNILLADEPTTALDVTIQAQVMEQMQKLQEINKMATILVTHDLAVIAEFCERVIVMYCGKIVEKAPVEQLFAAPQHPYTYGLLKSIPKIREQKIARLPIIEGTVPDIAHIPKGCRFAERCDRSTEECYKLSPELKSHDDNRAVACLNPYL